MENRPQGRQKNVTGDGKTVNRRGSGLGTGPVGNPGNGSGHTGGGNFGGNRPQRSGGSGGSGGGLLRIIVILVVLFFGGSGALNFLGDDADVSSYSQPSQSYSSNPSQSYTQPATTATLPSSHTSTGSGSNASSETTSGTSIWDLLGSGYGSGSQSSASSGWSSNTGSLNTKVDSAARAKYTKLYGSGKDTVTVMVYMCGTDLESQSGMGTKDLQEMVNATLNSKVNLILYTGGCKSWKNNIISSSANQIYKIEDGGLRCLNKNAGSGSMTSPNTLSSFIRFCSDNYPANRNILILWDHGGGSISGYGYDEKNRSSGSMTLKGLDQALSSGGVKFDFIGYDACLMGSLETALTMAPYADYLIASEETEPGLGWFYTNWLTALAKNPAISTLELGKKIADDFVSACARSAPGQKTTLSVVDLAELEKTVPDDFKAFSDSTLKLLKNNGYKTVSTARANARAFAVSNKTDQVDIVDLAQRLNTKESLAFADTVLSAVKYNKTSSNMTNAYGLSLYFPYQKVSSVSSAVAAYNDIGLDSAYTNCIRTFASMEAGGQTAAGGTHTPLTTLSGNSYGGQAVDDTMLIDVISQLFGSTLSYGRGLDAGYTAEYLSANRFDADALIWTASQGRKVLQLSESQWSLVQELELNVFIDDGEGYIDLGLDNTYDFTADGDLIGEYDGTWLAIDRQPIAYYYLDTITDGDHYTITGRVPVLLNGTRADLILVFTDTEPNGYIAGARTDYRSGETDTVAKGITELNVGDKIDFLCDYYTYDGTYSDSYCFGEAYTYTGNAVISNVRVNQKTSAAYRVTDIYQNAYWTPVM